MASNGTSKFLARILRHKPETIGITLDEHGWANVDGVIAGVRQRHGKPVIYQIDAKQMAADGYAFFRSVNGVWLIKAVPRGYMRIV